MARYRIGVDVGGTKLAYGLFDEDLIVVARAVEPSMPQSPCAEMISAMCGHIDALLIKAKVDKSEVDGIGLALPGHISHDEGRIITASNLPNFNDVPVREMMTSITGINTVLDNDANAAALAEYHMGAGRGSRNMVYITISTGVGAGLILDGRLFRGTYGSAGELGHMYVTDDTDIRCGCGRTGCVETVSSGTGMASYAKHEIVKGERTVLTGDIDARKIAAAAKQNDALAVRTLNRAADGLGTLFYNIYQIFACDRLVYGGGASKIGKPLLGRAEERFLNLIPQARKYRMQIVPAMLGDDTGIVGAALLCGE